MDREKYHDRNYWFNFNLGKYFEPVSITIEWNLCIMYKCRVFGICTPVEEPNSKTSLLSTSLYIRFFIKTLVYFEEHCTKKSSTQPEGFNYSLNKPGTGVQASNGIHEHYADRWVSESVSELSFHFIWSLKNCKSKYNWIWF